MKIRVYRYEGDPALTRGDFGVNIEGGHTRLDDPGGLYVFDPDFGDQLVGAAEYADRFGFRFLCEEEREVDPVRH